MNNELEKQYYDWLKMKVDPNILTEDEWTFIEFMFFRLADLCNAATDLIMNATPKKRPEAIKKAAHMLGDDEMDAEDILSMYTNVIDILKVCEDEKHKEFCVNNAVIVYVELGKMLDATKNSPCEHFEEMPGTTDISENIMYKLRASTKDNVNENIPSLSEEAIDYINNGGIYGKKI